MTTGAHLRALVLAAGLLPAVASAFFFPDASRTICGKDKMENMRDLDQSMQAMGKPIGILRSSEGSCTGTLIDKDLFLTAHHCLAECSDMQVTFGYLNRGETFKCKEIVETGNEDMNQ